MQRTIQRLKALLTTIRPNSNSDSSALRSDTRCDEETIFSEGLMAAGSVNENAQV